MTMGMQELAARLRELSEKAKSKSSDWQEAAAKYDNLGRFVAANSPAILDAVERSASADTKIDGIEGPDRETYPSEQVRRVLPLIHDKYAFLPDAIKNLLRTRDIQWADWHSKKMRNALAEIAFLRAELLKSGHRFADPYASAAITPPAAAPAHHYTERPPGL